MDSTINGFDGMLQQACQALQHLNRYYCKHPRCNPSTRSDIYRWFKRPMVRLLCERGYCTGVTRALDETKCRNCNGSGIDLVFRNKCRQCNGTGRYSPNGVSNVVMNFTFLVHGDIYRWHLPETEVDFVIPPCSLPQPRFFGDHTASLRWDSSEKEAMEVVRHFLAVASQRKAS